MKVEIGTEPRNSFSGNICFEFSVPCLALMQRNTLDSNTPHAGGNNSHRVIIPPHCNENPIYVFQEKELHGLSPNFYIPVSVNDLFNPRLGRSTYFPIVEQANRSLKDTWKWKLGRSRAIPFLRYCVFAVMQKNHFPFPVLKSCNRGKANPPLLVLNYQHILPSSLLLQPEA